MGYAVQESFKIERLVQYPELSVADGAILFWSKKINMRTSFHIHINITYGITIDELKKDVSKQL